MRKGMRMSWRNTGGDGRRHGGAARYLRAWLALGSLLLVAAPTSSGAAELTSVGLTRDIVEGPAGSDPVWLTAVGDQVYFSADDGEHGRELWASRGNRGRTRLVADLRAPSAWTTPSSFPSCLATLGETLLFEADGKLWRAGERPDAATLVSEVGPRCEDDALLVLGDELYFVGSDRSHGLELWRTDGTSAGTHMVADVNPGAGSSRPAEFVVVGDTLSFSAVDGQHDRELWRTDGTEVGTMLVADLNPLGNGIGEPGFTQTAVVGGILYFEGNDGVTGYELWRTDGTAEGTALVADVRPGPGASDPGELTAVGDVVYFQAFDDVHHHELWRSDGTLLGTSMVTELHPDGSSSPQKLTAVDDVLFFQAYSPAVGRDLWRTDGTAAGTEPIEIVPGPGSSNPGGATWQHELVVDPDGVLYFPAGDGEAGTELWRSDGTASGTWRIADLRPGSSGSNPTELTLVGGDLYFSADDGTLGRELYRATTSR